MDWKHSLDTYAESREQRCHNQHKILANTDRIYKSGMDKNYNEQNV